MAGEHFYILEHTKNCQIFHHIIMSFKTTRSFIFYIHKLLGIGFWNKKSINMKPLSMLPWIIWISECSSWFWFDWLDWFWFVVFYWLVKFFWVFFVIFHRFSFIWIIHRKVVINKTISKMNSHLCTMGGSTFKPQVYPLWCIYLLDERQFL